MGVILLGAAHGLAHHRMDETALDLDHDGLGILVGNDGALKDALRHITYPFTAARRCSVRTVSMRAMSRRRVRMRPVFSTCPLARWKRRLNWSFFRVWSW